MGVHQRVVTGLPSLAPANGDQATGPHDLDFGLGGGIAIGSDGALYVTNRSIFAGTGEVVRIVP